MDSDDDAHSSNGDEDTIFGVDQEQDQGEPEDVEEDNYWKKVQELERLQSGPILEEEEVIPPHTEQNKAIVPSTSKTGSTMKQKNGSTSRKGRGPAKGVQSSTPMYLEYDSMGQPCGQWRSKYGGHVGVCMRKKSILCNWKDVDEGLKQAMWEDTVNLFHIQPDDEKKKIFFSAVAERFRDFKSKLVSRWITKKRKKKKGTKGNECAEEGDNENPVKEWPYDIWPDISKEEWEAFVAKKTTPQEIERRAKASNSASQKITYHHMGKRTYSQARKEWIEEGFYQKLLPSGESSAAAASSSSVTSVVGDRVLDWYCSLHSRDSSGKRIITDLGVKKIADAVIGLKEKEVAGEFKPPPNKDALIMVVGEDHTARVKGRGGVRLGKKKGFGGERSSTPSSTLKMGPEMQKRVPELVQEQVQSQFKEQVHEQVQVEFKSLLENIGLPDLASLVQSMQHQAPQTSLVDMVRGRTPPRHQSL